jgi:hypothetical protein
MDSSSNMVLVLNKISSKFIYKWIQVVRSKDDPDGTPVRRSLGGGHNP